MLGGGDPPPKANRKKAQQELVPEAPAMKAAAGREAAQTHGVQKTLTLLSRVSSPVIAHLCVPAQHDGCYKWGAVGLPGR